MANRPEISIVSPVYMAEAIVDELVNRIVSEVELFTTDFEIILVEDGSTDHSWERIAANCEQEPRVRGIRLSRNCGQHIAITAGVHAACGHYVVVMDCDLQDNPRYIRELYDKAKSGFDIVYARKKKRAHGWLKNATAYLFNWLFNWLIDSTDNRSSASIGTYSLISRKVADAFNQLHETQRHYLMLLRTLGFRSSFIEIEQDERLVGGSSYTPLKLLRHAVNGIASQSDKLLRLSIWVGFAFTITAGIAIAVIVEEYFRVGFRPGWPSLFVLILFSTGLILSSIGILGMYIGKIFEQVKGRPLYHIDHDTHETPGATQARLLEERFKASSR